MPIYDYICGSCGERIEVIHGVHAPGPQACPTCGFGPMRKALHAPTVHFKGSGWAKKERTTGAAKAARDAAAPTGTDAGSGSAGSEAGADAAPAGEVPSTSGASTAPTAPSGGAPKPSNPAPAEA